MNTPPANQDEFARFVKQAMSQCDWLDGCAIVGFHPVTGEAMTFKFADDTKTVLALNGLLLAAVAQPAYAVKPDEPFA